MTIRISETVALEAAHLRLRDAEAEANAVIREILTAYKLPEGTNLYIVNRRSGLIEVETPPPPQVVAPPPPPERIEPADNGVDTVEDFTDEEREEVRRRLPDE